MLFDLLQLYIMFKIVVWSYKLLTNRKSYGKNRKSKSIESKIIEVISNAIHRRLDNKLKTQRLAVNKPQADNIVQFRQKA